MTYSRIIGTGSYLPPQILTNADLEKKVDTSNEWIVERTGIRERRVAGANETSSSMALEASRQALAAAGISANDLDLIIVATTTPDLVFPATACLLQDRLGVRGCPAFDVQAVCSGFIYALTVADKFVRSGTSKRALVVGTETFTRILDWNDRTTCVLFGDGAGAVVIEASDTPGILSSHLHADGQYANLLCVPSGVSKGYEKVIAGQAFVQMSGSEVFKIAVRVLGEVVDEALDAVGMTRTDIDWLVPHQANIRIISATAKKLGLPMDRVVVTVDRHGNTSAASIPLAFDEAVRDKRIKRGDVVLMEGVGGGFTWGSVLFKY